MKSTKINKERPGLAHKIIDGGKAHIDCNRVPIPDRCRACPRRGSATTSWASGRGSTDPTGPDLRPFSIASPWPACGQVKMFLKAHTRALFLYFRRFNIVDSICSI